MTNLEIKIEKLLEEKIKNLGYELYDVIYEKEAKDYYLRIFIDSPNGINLEDCEKVSNSISDMLDEADYIKEQYFLEVSSSGLERVLRQDKHLSNSIGKEVEVRLYKPINKERIFVGILENYDNEYITINNTSKIQIERKNISLIKTTYKW